MSYHLKTRTPSENILPAIIFGRRYYNRFFLRVLNFPINKNENKIHLYRNNIKNLLITTNLKIRKSIKSSMKIRQKIRLMHYSIDWCVKLKKLFEFIVLEKKRTCKFHAFKIKIHSRNDVRKFGVTFWQ